jgi:hypothetical protein
MTKYSYSVKIVESAGYYSTYYFGPLPGGQGARLTVGSPSGPSVLAPPSSKPIIESFLACQGRLHHEIRSGKGTYKISPYISLEDADKYAEDARQRLPAAALILVTQQLLLSQLFDQDQLSELAYLGNQAGLSGEEVQQAILDLDPHKLMVGPGKIKILEDGIRLLIERGFSEESDLEFYITGKYQRTDKPIIKLSASKKEKKPPWQGPTGGGAGRGAA